MATFINYFSVLITTLVFTSSCCRTQKVVQKEPILNDNTAIVTEVTDAVEAPSKLATLKLKDNSIEESLGEDGTVSDDGIIETTETIYTAAFDHAIFNNLLKKHVTSDGNVNYNGFKSDSKTLQIYIDLLKTYQPIDSWAKEDKLAYWINAYNALTIDLILRNYPTKSIKDIKDPWDQRLWQLGKKKYNLNDIEHKILRKMNEPRIHFAIVCASVSCPKLQNGVFTALNLEKQLTNATKEFLTDPAKNELSENNIKLSKIFKWFKKDFEQNGSLIDFFNQYSKVSISNGAKKSYKDYNWDLND
jgi:hypothetical protein